MQLAKACTSRDLKEFFELAVGKVRDVKMIVDRSNRRSKGIAYVEFYDLESVAKAQAMTGQRLLGVPIIILPSQAEKNKYAYFFFWVVVVVLLFWFVHKKQTFPLVSLPFSLSLSPSLSLSLSLSLSFFFFNINI